MRRRRLPSNGQVAGAATWICLLAVFVGPLLAPVYMAGQPRLLGWPFFYWYQFLWVPLGAVLLTGACFLSRRRKGPNRSPKNRA
ncbi:DUF3311 domain-containing protein [Streptomyces sp. NBC_01618]|uniref:DUF3311 domain-containing protein n=1 Tax=Streptomyces sp. NBC_01618 TaxID=2975900 RepID=UPI00386AB020|nr:DUF3311 domain-containing protein [Streptomyces sp. NBC_01618]